MKIRFAGIVELPFADDRGTYDIWLLEEIVRQIKKGPEIEDVYKSLRLAWEPFDDLAV